MDEVNIRVTLQVEPVDTPDGFSTAICSQAALEAVQHALHLVQANGFSHVRSDELSVCVTRVEIERKLCEYSPEVMSLAKDIRALVGDEEADQGLLDEMVHDLKSTEATDINNGLLEDVLTYIIECNSQSEAYQAALSAANEDAIVTCKFCERRVPAKTAHQHEGSWVGDECCWDERLRATE